MADELEMVQKMVARRQANPTTYAPDLTLALARVLAVATTAVAMQAHLNDNDCRYNSPGSLSYWERKFERLHKEHTTAVAALRTEAANESL